MVQLLVAEVDHLVPEQGVPDLGELLVADAGDVDAADLRAHGRRQRLHLDEIAGLGGIVELVGRMQPHGDVLASDGRSTRQGRTEERAYGAAAGPDA